VVLLYLFCCNIYFSVHQHKLVHIYLSVRAVVLKPWPARSSGVAREAIFIGKKT